MAGIDYNLSFDKLLLFGDSITEFCYNINPISSKTPSYSFALGPALQETYKRKLDVVQRGFAGYNTRHAKQLLPKILDIEHASNKSSKVSLIVLYFGSNDAAVNGPQKVPLDEFLCNMELMINQIISKNISLIVLGPAVHDAETWNPAHSDDVKLGNFRTNENNKFYCDELAKLCFKINIPYIHLYDIFSTYKGPWQDLLTDGIHYSGEGYRLMYNEIMENIKIFYPQLYPDNIKSKLPAWKDIKLDSFDNL
ncbi:SGNH/GDSL hydrolase family protein [Ascoidea rubescens DSM 1968]|uniref:SGNH hydrolase n=1 Tax=Ascoidea rubescens DSM 1968 TaxID=1344418 RepID=A0A1D2VC19_9ASCO|nr:SGNH hydrolase [Ascoidea rubescens DSM 1968]ODV59033.1 SGNH hydrolase [Ascoidea rubescens DSM 1968]